VNLSVDTNRREFRFDERGLARVEAAIAADIERGLYDGAVIVLARGGEIGLRTAIGYAERADERPAQIDDVFRVLSLSKAFTNTLALAAVDSGRLALTTKVVDVIPEFAGSDRFRRRNKDRVTVAHLMTHRAALVPTPTPLPYEQLGNLANVVAAICEMDLIGEPGETVNYSPALVHAILGEMLRRTWGGDRSFSDIAREELFDPLGMTSTAFGVPEHLVQRVVPLVARFDASPWLGPSDIEVLNDVVRGDAELPWVGAVSSVDDVFRFAEMLRRGGQIDGTRILSRAILEQATRVWTGSARNDLYRGLYVQAGWDPAPANLGLGFALRGEGLHHTIFGTQTSSGTFGNAGAGSTLFWVDPAREVTFACLCSGVMRELPNIERFQRLSDMAIAALA
jgi:CubicO group peptidase (beta-lactamase class C family)